jgi:hypothetical protein
VRASFAGNGNYNGDFADKTITIAKKDQTITFVAPSGVTFGDGDSSLGATASSGLAVSYSSSTTTNCTIVDGKLHVVGAGTCTITASQDGNSNYNAATSVEKTFTIAKKDQTITFAAIPDKTLGSADFAPIASASSGLAVSYSAGPSTVCSIVDGIHIVGIGTCTVTASQAGDSNYNSSQRQQQFAVVYRWDGFLQPINDTAHQVGVLESKFKLGSTVPVKFQIKNAAGAPVQQGTVPTLQVGANRGQCDATTSPESTYFDASTPGTAFRWDSSLQGYIYNLSTKGLTSGEYRIYANLADSTRQYVDLCLTK